ncbi:alpha/beta fold hydrolase [Streptomyces coelicoflavus]|uniref:alpha/beta fold hydrolase n=1 Tax=Streptomyces coelicoflavus TaxID=285562 RepID=UPI0038280231
MTAFVLVHGSWTGGWHWELVRPHLEAAGHRVYTPSLTGLGDRHHLAAEGVGLSTHVDDISLLLEWERLEDVVLVGHSYGGMVITGAAARVPERVGQLVYIDAFLPRTGESAWDLLPWQRAAFQGLRLEQQPWLLRPADFNAVFPGLDDFDTTRLTPMPVRTHEEPLAAAPEPGSIAAAYLHCTAAPDAFGEMARRAEADGMNVSATDAGHMVISTRPFEVARVLLNAAAHMDRARA